MFIKKRIKLGNDNYYINCECEYKNKNDVTHLCLKTYSDDYYDGGDLSILIKKVEDNYNESICKKYDGENWFLSKCLYIYDNIPFISGVGDYYMSDGFINSTAYITKEELDKYISDKKINMKDNTNFKLFDERTW